jgi:hypothetical protein
MPRLVRDGSDAPHPFFGSNDAKSMVGAEQRQASESVRDRATQCEKRIIETFQCDVDVVFGVRSA